MAALKGLIFFFFSKQTACSSSDLWYTTVANWSGRSACYEESAGSIPDRACLCLSLSEASIYLSIHPSIHPSIHSFIPAISIAPLKVLYYSEALPTTARILYRSFTPVAPDQRYYHLRWLLL